jgi:hypothetical protein
MKVSHLQRILSVVVTVTGELCDTDHNWEQSAKVKSIMVYSGPYSQRKREEILILNNACILSDKGKILNQ